jgi:hypothetical protein
MTSEPSSQTDLRGSQRGRVQGGGSAAGTGRPGVGLAAQSIRHAAPATAGSRRGPAAQPHSCDAAKRLGHSCHKLSGSELRRGVRGRRTMRDCKRPHGHTGGAWGAPACAVEAEVEQPTHDHLEQLDTKARQGRSFAPTKRRLGRIRAEPDSLVAFVTSVVRPATTTSRRASAAPRAVTADGRAAAQPAGRPRTVRELGSLYDVYNVCNVHMMCI